MLSRSVAAAANISGSTITNDIAVLPVVIERSGDSASLPWPEGHSEFRMRVGAAKNVGLQT
jgi:hypothetical protein